MASDDDPTNARAGEPQLSDSLRTFGAVLRALRDEAGLTREEFGPLVGYSAPYVAKIEQGKRYPPSDLPARAEEALGPLAVKVLQAAGRSLRRRPGLASWFQHWAGIEEEAISLYAYECRVVPGLLQPEPYIRTVSELNQPPLTQAQIDQQVCARLERQTLLVDKPHTTFSFVLEQHLLECQLGGMEVAKHLLDHLLKVSAMLNVDLQVMALRQPDHAGFEGHMYLAETETHEWFGYTEGHRASSLVSTPRDASAMLQRYGKLRAQALDARATVDLLRGMREAL